MRLAHAKRRDANEKQIVEALRARHLSVMQTDQVDLIVGYNGRSYMFEVKDPKKLFKADGVTFKAGAVTEAQSRLRSIWRGHYSIVWELQQILDQIKYRGDSDAG